jgi:ATP-dependent DNA helicase RecQ
LINTLKDKFGIDRFKDGQREAIEAAMSGRDVLCFMPTGYGKSVCFQMPALCSYGITLVISPLIALMNDQVSSLRSVGVSAVAVHSESDRDDIMRKLSIKDTKLVYLSPERLSQQGFLDFISERKIERVVIDEAHCISSWGSGFRPEYQMIGGFIKELSIKSGTQIPVSAFTATANHRVINDIIQYAGINKRSAYFYKGDVVRSNIYISMTKVDSKNKELVRRLSVNKNESTIIYCSTIKSLKTTSKLLDAEGVIHEIYHAKLSKENKQHIVEKFMNDDVDIILATSAFGMGINKPNIRNIIHFQLPESVEMYYQQVGRAGRDGLSSTATLLYNEKDKSLSRFMTQLSYPKYENVWSVIMTLKAFEMDGMVDVDEADFLLASPIKISPHELKGALKLLTSKGMVMDYSDNFDNHIRFELVNINKPLNKSALNTSRKNALESFDELFRLSESTLCRSFLIDDYFSSKKISYYECKHCDNCVEKFKRQDLNREKVSHDELKLIYADVMSLELFSVSALALHWIGHSEKRNDSPSFGIFSTESYQMIYKTINVLIKTGFFIKVQGDLIVNDVTFKKHLSSKSGIVISNNKITNNIEQDKTPKNSLYLFLKRLRDELSESNQKSPSLILTEIQLRKIASSPEMDENGLIKLIGKDRSALIFDSYVDFFIKENSSQSPSKRFAL